MFQEYIKLKADNDDLRNAKDELLKGMQDLRNDMVELRKDKVWLRSYIEDLRKDNVELRIDKAEFKKEIVQLEAKLLAIENFTALRWEFNNDYYPQLDST